MGWREKQLDTLQRTIISACFSLDMCIFVKRKRECVCFTVCSRQRKFLEIHLGYHCKKSSETDAHNGDLVECSIAFRRWADSSQNVRTFKKMGHRFRLTKKDDYF
jgi:hypothetical protein